MLRVTVLPETGERLSSPRDELHLNTKYIETVTLQTVSVVEMDDEILPHVSIHTTKLGHTSKLGHFVHHFPIVRTQFTKMIVTHIRQLRQRIRNSKLPPHRHEL